MNPFDELARFAPQRETLFERFSGRLIEQRAELADRSINDRLLVELVMNYVHAERELHKLNEVKNRFLGMAAHDLRNPLTSIRGLSELLLTEDLPLEPAQRHEMLQTIHRVSHEMLNLVNDLLNVSVIESGRFDLRRAPTVLAHLVAERLRLIDGVARRKDIAIHTQLTECTPLSIDAERIGQVVDNLLTNAVKFSESGTIIEVRVDADDDGQRLLVIDQGPGIPEHERVHLFKDFQKLSTRPTGGESSTGLGLAIVKKIVDAHGCTIAVDNGTDAQGQPLGSCFQVHFPQDLEHSI